MRKWSVDNQLPIDAIGYSVCIREGESRLDPHTEQAMRWTIGKAISVATVALLAISLPRAAEAQARGTVQATATVVDTRQGFEALSMVRQVTQIDTRTQAPAPVESVAHISAVRTTARAGEPALVVTVDYSRN